MVGCYCIVPSLLGPRTLSSLVAPLPLKVDVLPLLPVLSHWIPLDTINPGICTKDPSQLFFWCLPNFSNKCPELSSGLQGWSLQQRSAENSPGLLPSAAKSTFGTDGALGPFRTLKRRTLCFVTLFLQSERKCYWNIFNYIFESL